VKPRFEQKLKNRKEMGSLRSLSLFNNLVDFCSNDYLGLSRLTVSNLKSQDGSTGSRLISGNSVEAETTEKYIAANFQAEAALIFNSGYDANVGLFLFCSSTQRNCFLR
jgi:8-amino-7-oxononanoate synthase